MQKTTCPFCGKKTLFTDGRRYTCIACKSSGGRVEYYAEKYGMTVEEVENWLKKKPSPQELYDAMETACQFFERQQGSYFTKERGLSEQTVKKFRLGYAWWETPPIENKEVKQELKLDFPFFFGRAIFPIMDAHGRVVGFSGRTLTDSKQKYKNSPQSRIFKKKNLLYGLSLGNFSKGAVLVEGQMDVIAMHDAGFPLAVASMGTSLTRSQCVLLKSRTNRVLLCYDNDAAGHRNMVRSIYLLHQVGIHPTVILLQNAKDPDELLHGFGRSCMIENLKNEVSDTEYLRYHAEDLSDILSGYL